MAFIMCWLLEKWAEYPRHVPQHLFVRAVKGHGRVEAQLHTRIPLLDGGDCLALFPIHFTPSEGATGSH